MNLTTENTQAAEYKNYGVVYHDTASQRWMPRFDLSEIDSPEKLTTLTASISASKDLDSDTKARIIARAQTLAKETLPETEVTLAEGLTPLEDVHVIQITEGNYVHLINLIDDLSGVSTQNETETLDPETPADTTETASIDESVLDKETPVVAESTSTDDPPLLEQFENKLTQLQKKYSGLKKTFKKERARHKALLIEKIVEQKVASGKSPEELQEKYKECSINTLETILDELQGMTLQNFDVTKVETVSPPALWQSTDPKTGKLVQPELGESEDESTMEETPKADVDEVLYQRFFGVEGRKDAATSVAFQSTVTKEN